MVGQIYAIDIYGSDSKGTIFAYVYLLILANASSVV